MHRLDRARTKAKSDSDMAFLELFFGRCPHGRKKDTGARVRDFPWHAEGQEIAATSRFHLIGKPVAVDNNKKEAKLYVLYIQAAVTQPQIVVRAATV